MVLSLQAELRSKTRAMARAARDRLARTLRGAAQTAFSAELTARPGRPDRCGRGLRAGQVPGDSGEGPEASRPRPAGPVRPGRGYADRPGCPRHARDPRAPGSRRVGRRRGDRRPHHGGTPARTAERCRAHGRPSLPAGLRAGPVLPGPPGHRERRLDGRDPGGDRAVGYTGGGLANLLREHFSTPVPREQAFTNRAEASPARALDHGMPALDRLSASSRTTEVSYRRELQPTGSDRDSLRLSGESCS